MTKDELFNSLDGLFAYDAGSRDSGIHDIALKEVVRQHLQKEADNDSPYRVIPPIIDEFCHSKFMSPEARKQGYGLEDVISFVKWLEELMGWDII